MLIFSSCDDMVRDENMLVNVIDSQIYEYSLEMVTVNILNVHGRFLGVGGGERW